MNEMYVFFGFLIGIVVGFIVGGIIVKRIIRNDILWNRERADGKEN